VGARKRFNPIRLLLVAAAVSLTLSALGAAQAQAQATLCSGASPAELALPNVVRLDLTTQELRRDFIDPATGLSGQGYRPLRITGFSEGGPTRFMTKWIKVSTPVDIRPSIDLTGAHVAATAA